MHSRIFQIEKELVQEDEYIISADIPEWFTNSLADYVDGDCDREDDIDWLMTCSIGNFTVRDGNKLTFTSDVSGYFKDKYEAFIKASQELNKVSFDDFVSDRGIYSILYNLKEAYNDKYSFYVYSDWELHTLDEWLRQVKPGETYYIGGVIDYHF